jgi:hypothetical protein
MGQYAGLELSGLWVAARTIAGRVVGVFESTFVRPRACKAYYQGIRYAALITDSQEVRAGVVAMVRESFTNLGSKSHVVTGMTQGSVQMDDIDFAELTSIIFHDSVLSMYWAHSLKHLSNDKQSVVIICGA